MGYSLPDTTVPRMSSKNHKVFTIFFAFFSHKTVVFHTEDVSLRLQKYRGGRYINAIDFHIVDVV